MREERKTKGRAASKFLDGATVDLNGRLKFPARIAKTNLRPDMLLLSGKPRRVGIVELTLPS